MDAKEMVKRRGSEEKRRMDSLGKRAQGAFPADRIADEHSHEINHLILAHTRTDKTHPLLHCFHQPKPLERVSHHCHFREPGRGTRNRSQGRLDLY